ncbi:MAG TPA: CBS domain-containing protein, partial [Verrucomicrobiae bacterium]
GSPTTQFVRAIAARRGSQAPFSASPPLVHPAKIRIHTNSDLFSVSLKEFLNSSQNVEGVIAYDLMRPPPKTLTPGQRLLDALPVVLQSELRNVPVVNNPVENRLVGSVSRAEVLAIFSEAIAEKSKPTG